MKKDTIFFDKEGLTTTSANHIANMAKEAYRFIETSLESAVFYTTTISILGSTSSNTLKEGVEKEFLDNLETNLNNVAKLKSLIAWLREAIKAKETLIKEAQNLKDSTIAETLGIVLPEPPAIYPRLTEDDVVGTWSIKQRNRYYYLDTLCSTIGKYIHPDRSFSNAKEDLAKVLNQRNVATGTGRDTVIYTRIPTVTMSDVENTFFTLQDNYRGYQAELNSMKHQIEVELQNDEREKVAKEIKEAKDYQAALDVAMKEITAYRKETVQTMQSLKIVIPDSLKSIYNSVSAMGKKE